MTPLAPNRRLVWDSRPRRPQLGGLLLVALLLFPGCRDTEAPTEERLRAVRTLVVETNGEGRLRTFSGTSQSSQESRLSFKVAGTIDALPVEVGDRLAAGDLIAALSPAQYELQVERAEAEVAAARANLRNAEASYERTKELYADNNAARSDLDATRANAESARAQVGASERQLELAKLDLSYTRLRANEDCSIASLDVEVNENVGSGATVATVTCGDQLEVDLAIPEGLIGELSQDMAASVRFDALGETVFPGSVSQIGVVARDGATFPVTVTLESAEGLRAGLAAEVTLRFADETGTPTLVVPLSSVVESDGQTFVFLAESDGTAGEAVVTRRDVTVGELTDRGLEVQEGLSAGDRVITAGTSVIREGLRVLADATPGPATNPTATDSAPDPTTTDSTDGDAQ